MRVTVAIPLFNGADTLDTVLAAVNRQHVEGEYEVIVVDSGSHDGSRDIARRYGAEVLQIEAGEFGHGRTRNLLMTRSRGEYVAFLTQDSVPADEQWLSCLLDGFGQADDVGITFGPYRPDAQASTMVARELTMWFQGFSRNHRPVVDRLGIAERAIEARALLGRRGFFTDANGCVSRAAWERVPFRDVPYAEDHVLAHDMLRAGFAKVFVPDAVVIHSHEYRLAERLRRSFDESRALRDVYGWSAPASPGVLARNLWGSVGADRRWALSQGEGCSSPVAQLQLLVRATLYHGASLVGAFLGARSAHLPGLAVRRLSLEGRPR